MNSLTPVTPVADNDGRVVKFSPQYKLAFTLLNEDSTLGSAILDWDAPTLIRSTSSSSRSFQVTGSDAPNGFSGSIGPLLGSLAPLHNFTIETQAQYFAPLAVELHHKYDEAGAYVDEADLKAFVNNAEWNLGASCPRRVSYEHDSGSVQLTRESPQRPERRQTLYCSSRCSSRAFRTVRCGSADKVRFPLSPRNYSSEIRS